MLAREQLIYDVYQAVARGLSGDQTLLIVIYDEHGGCYDHVGAPANAVPANSLAGESGFDFRRFGVCVPTLLISPWIDAGTKFRVPDGTTPFDHTSILKTSQILWNMPALTAPRRGCPGCQRRLHAHDARRG
ncbi:alkaline phosphatase family protein [Caballeronia ptereochthonis]|uniref:Phospholipase n=1 Tax=Caballeronia ptereochthonis TaxID=1777144 RepID=A0A158CVB0_9BURK|nr:alkaline phosphatase family protein [Caballeronia ptereochthonis]SAK86264.1 phospholipase [Caballeronia ptereochthonis]